MTARQTAVLAVCAIVAAAGMVAGAALWMTAAVAVAAVVALAGYVATDWSRGVTTRRLRPAGGASIEVAIGSNVPVEIEVENEGRLPVAWVLAEDTLPRRLDAGSKYRPPLQVDGESLAVMTLRRGESQRLAYTVPCRRRGYFEVGPTVLETGDPLGLFRRYRVDRSTATVTVLPKVVRLGDYEIGSRRPIGEIRIRDNAIVDPTRIRGIRRWQIGDPLRSVHWAATARTGTLHSKQYESSSIIGATLLVDLHVSTNPDASEPHRGDLAVTAAASICAALHEMSEPFALATNGRDAGRAAPHPPAGRGHRFTTIRDRCGSKRHRQRPAQAHRDRRRPRRGTLQSNPPDARSAGADRRADVARDADRIPRPDQQRDDADRDLATGPTCDARSVVATAQSRRAKSR